MSSNSHGHHMTLRSHSANRECSEEDSERTDSESTTNSPETVKSESTINSSETAIVKSESTTKSEKKKIIKTDQQSTKCEKFTVRLSEDGKELKTVGKPRRNRLCSRSIVADHCDWKDTADNRGRSGHSSHCKSKKAYAMGFLLCAHYHRKIHGFQDHPNNAVHHRVIEETSNSLQIAYQGTYSNTTQMRLPGTKKKVIKYDPNPLLSLWANHLAPLPVHHHSRDNPYHFMHIFYCEHLTVVFPDIVMVKMVADLMDEVSPYGSRGEKYFAENGLMSVPRSLTVSKCVSEELKPNLPDLESKSVCSSDYEAEVC